MKKGKPPLQVSLPRRSAEMNALLPRGCPRLPVSHSTLASPSSVPRFDGSRERKHSVRPNQRVLCSKRREIDASFRCYEKSRSGAGKRLVSVFRIKRKPTPRISCPLCMSTSRSLLHRKCNFGNTAPLAPDSASGFARGLSPGLAPSVAPGLVRGVAPDSASDPALGLVPAAGARHRMPPRRIRQHGGNGELKTRLWRVETAGDGVP